MRSIFFQILLWPIFVVFGIEGALAWAQAATSMRGTPPDGLLAILIAVVAMGALGVMAAISDTRKVRPQVAEPSRPQVAEPSK